MLLGLAAGALAQSSSASSASAAASASASSNSTSSSNATLVAFAEVTGSGIDALIRMTYVPGQGTQVEGTISGLPINDTLAAAGNVRRLVRSISLNFSGHDVPLPHPRSSLASCFADVPRPMP